MRLNYIMLAATALALLGGCKQKEECLVSRDGFVTVRLESSVDTRVSYDDVGKFSWNTGDKLAVFVDGAYTHDIEVDPSLGRISVNGTRAYYAVYPSDVADDGNYGNPTLKVNLPASYDISDIVGDGGGMTDPYRRMEEYSPLPMVAGNDMADEVLLFRNVGGLLRVKCVGLPAGTKTVTVRFDKDVTGVYQVDLTDKSAPVIRTAETGANNIVVFTVSESGLAAGTTVVLNVPVPCGTYGSVKVEASGSVTSYEETFVNGPVQSLVFGRNRGRMLVAGVESDGWEFVLDGLKNVETSYLGGVKTLSDGFVSYKKTASGDKVAVPFKFQYSENEGGPWTDGLPDWLTIDGGLDFGGMTTPHTVHVAVSPQENTAQDSHADALKARPGKAEGESVAANYFDLSLVIPSVAADQPGGWDTPNPSTARRTANCYVVQSPGKFRIPLVYGNGIDWEKSPTDGINEKAYRGMYADGTYRPDAGEYRSLYNGVRSGYLGRFKDHLDANITSPYIATQQTGKTLTAELIWTDEMRWINEKRSCL